jgi:hypothetical protein
MNHEHACLVWDPDRCARAPANPVLSPLSASSSPPPPGLPRNDPNYDSEEEEAAAAAALVYQTPAASRVKAEVEAYKEEVGGAGGVWMRGWVADMGS